MQPNCPVIKVEGCHGSKPLRRLFGLVFLALVTSALISTSAVLKEPTGIQIVLSLDLK